MNLIIYLIIVYFVYFSFFFIIAIFGNAIIRIFVFLSKRKWNLTLVENLLISYAIGIAFFIQYAYILNLLKQFNLKTIYTPLLFIDIIILIFLLRNRHLFKYIESKLKIIRDNKREIIIYLLILIFPIFLEYYILWPIISESTSLVAWDPYLYLETTLFLKKNGFINFPDQAIYYPWGFNFILGAQILPYSSFSVLFFFMKLACLPHLNIYLITLFFLCRRFLKWNSLILLCLVSIFTSSFLLYRTLLFLSSTVSVFIILISFLIILSEADNRLLGITISSAFLVNPIYSLFFIFVVLGFYLISILFNSQKRYHVIKEFLVIILQIPIFLILFIYSIYYFYDYTIKKLINDFFLIFSESINIIIFESLSKVILYQNSFPLFLSIIFNPINIFRKNLLQNLFFILIELFAILALFLKANKADENYRNFFHALKISSLILLSREFYTFFIKDTLFLTLFYERVIELYFPFIIMLSLMFLKRFITACKNSRQFWLQKNDFQFSKII